MTAVGDQNATTERCRRRTRHIADCASSKQRRRLSNQEVFNSETAWSSAQTHWHATCCRGGQSCLFMSDCQLTSLSLSGH